MTSKAKCEGYVLSRKNISKSSMFFYVQIPDKMFCYAAQQDQVLCRKNRHIF